MSLYRRQALRALKRCFLVITIALLLYLLLVAKTESNSEIDTRDGRLKLTMQFEQAEHDGDTKALHEDADPNPMTIHLVIAATASEDISWTSQLKIPGLKVIHYVADDLSAPHHPPANKGHEAMIYHCYFYDFYEDLPDIAILTHAHDISWHIEPLLSHSLSYAISHLDLLAVKQRGYANLRVSWDNACPALINTTLEGTSDLALEAQFTRHAFLGNFVDRTIGPLDHAPEILAQPCCSQFAVTRDVILSVKKEQYLHFINWLLRSSIHESFLGRTWEHLFQWLFTTKAVDCPVEWKTYCKMYNICFESKEEYEKYVELESLQADLIDQYDLGILKALWTWGLGNGRQKLVREIGDISRQINEMKRQARENGQYMPATTIDTESLYLDD